MKSDAVEFIRKKIIRILSNWRFRLPCYSWAADRRPTLWFPNGYETRSRVKIAMEVRK